MDEHPLTLLLEYLDNSPQPTLVLRLSDTDAEFTYANPALQRLEDLHIEVLSQFRRIPKELGHNTNAGGTCEKGSIALQISFCELNWAVRIVGKQWLIVESKKESDREGGNEPATIRQSTNATTLVQRPSPDEEISALGQSLAKRSIRRPPLGAVGPHGHLGDLSYLEWMRQFDWASSPIGAIDEWPAELRQTCECILASPDPVNVLWGEDCIILYNKAFSAVVGDQHPSALGRPFKENFAQWTDYYKLFDRMRDTGESVQQEKVRRLLVRNGHKEECFFRFLLTPVLAADGFVAGISTRVHEVTRQVIFERRMQLLTTTNKAIATTYNLHDLCRAAAGVFDTYQSDIHFAAIYSAHLNAHTLDLKLEATAGLSTEHDNISATSKPISPQFGIHNTLLEACRTRQSMVLSTSNGSLNDTTLDQLKHHGALPCREIVVHPLKCFVEDNIAAVMIVGTSPLRKFDDDYRSFLHLMTSQIENGITVVRGIEREKELHRAQLTSELERRFWRFAAKAPIGIYMYNSDNVLTFWNAAFEDICGRSGHEMSQPMAWMDTVHPDGVADITAVWESYKNSGCDEAVTFEVQLKKPWTQKHGDGEVSLDRTYALGILQPEYSEDGKLKGNLGCITDISLSKWAEKTQSARLSEAIEQKRQQENFLDVTSHEMRNPLNAIFQCAYELTENIKSILDNGQGNQAQRLETLHESLDLATTITYCANHQKRIVDDILTLSKLDARLVQIYPESINPIKLYREIIGLFGPEIRASGMNTNFMIGTGYNGLELKQVMMDPSRVTQVVINLLSNAIKFTKKGKQRNLEMTLDAHLEEPANKPMDIRYVPSGVRHNNPTDQPEWGQGKAIYLSFSVKDSGVGMTPEESGKLFQKFSQASPRTHTQFGGSGLGLYISRNLAELHGGRIGLSSQAGFGSKFEFYIKVRQTEPTSVPVTPVDRPDFTLGMEPLTTIISPAMQQSQTPSKLPNTSKTSVLIVEDNLINQRLLRKLITKHGYDTLVANNGEEALTIIVSSTWNPAHNENNSDVVPTIDIVLCDIEMPIMDGKTCVRRVRRLQDEGLLTDNIAMIAITGNARLEQVQEMRQCGFDDVVTKPYKIDQLLTVIEQYVGT
ncbi:uncharacterized protein M421DRAFT_56134 [Didymella exigua CBS 183.55]|uniref:histidine kinase n=1 Tax=Didymella exigua CBS 183.55 TaxID=1150837 RepID=A0A6A5RUY1_9PLEO|nr:uncharacterized protein M421DRAFT_56134 [Didymella exigua CBS 183.55]KAF1931672.1 hypothetical protein M421DRAFT_56134 [Didymella exigua CBS 183.55]